MHETHLMADLMKKIEVVAKEHHAARVTGVKVRLGALSQISEEHFRHHFLIASQGTIASEAKLEILFSPDLMDPRAQAVFLEDIKLEKA